MPGATKVSWAENWDTLSREGEEGGATGKEMVALPRGTLLRAEAPQGLRWRREEDQEEEEEGDESSADLWALLLMEARRASQELQRRRLSNILHVYQQISTIKGQTTRRKYIQIITQIILFYSVFPTVND